MDQIPELPIDAVASMTDFQSYVIIVCFVFLFAMFKVAFDLIRRTADDVQTTHTEDDDVEDDGEYVHIEEFEPGMIIRSFYEEPW